MHVYTCILMCICINFTCVPGLIPIPRNLSPGMELRVPVLFLDMVALVEEDSLPCQPTTLFGEKPESMIEIPIIKREENDVRRVC